jgi:hypothetical protein
MDHQKLQQMTNYCCLWIGYQNCLRCQEHQRHLSYWSQQPLYRHCACQRHDDDVNWFFYLPSLEGELEQKVADRLPSYLTFWHDV